MYSVFEHTVQVKDRSVEWHFKNLKWGRCDCCYTDWWREDGDVCITLYHEAWIGSCDFSSYDAHV